MIKTEIQDHIDMNVHFYDVMTSRSAKKIASNRQFARQYSTKMSNQNIQ